jgi:hypothetical protein
MWPRAACRNITGRKLDTYILYIQIYKNLCIVEVTSDTCNHFTLAHLTAWRYTVYGRKREPFAGGLIHSEIWRCPICSSVALTNYTLCTMHTVQYVCFLLFGYAGASVDCKTLYGEAPEVSLQCGHECASGLWWNVGNGSRYLWTLVERKFKLPEAPDLHLVLYFNLNQISS